MNQGEEKDKWLEQMGYSCTTYNFLVIIGSYQTVVCVNSRSCCIGAARVHIEERTPVCGVFRVSNDINVDVWEELGA